MLEVIATKKALRIYAAPCHHKAISVLIALSRRGARHACIATVILRAQDLQWTPFSSFATALPPLTSSHSRLCQPTTRYSLSLGFRSCQESSFRSTFAAAQAVQEFVRAHAEALILTAEGLQREFFISFVNVPHLTKLRHLMARHLGQLVCFAGDTRQSLLDAPVHAHDASRSGWQSCLCSLPSAAASSHLQSTEPSAAVPLLAGHAGGSMGTLHDRRTEVMTRMQLCRHGDADERGAAGAVHGVLPLPGVRHPRAQCGAAIQIHRAPHVHPDRLPEQVRCPSELIQRHSCSDQICQDTGGKKSDIPLNRRAWCRKSWALEKEESTFIDWQRAKVQETTDEARPLAPGFLASLHT